MFYGNATDFEKYLTDRGREFSAQWSDEDIEAALLVVSEWLDSQYDDIWIGYKVTFDQERAWPRQSAMVLSYPSYTYKTNEIPQQVIYATYEAAQRELNNKGCLSPDYQPTPYNSVSIYNAVTVEYSTTVSSAGDIMTQIPAIQNLMSSLIDPQKSSGGNGLCGKAVRV